MTALVEAERNIKNAMVKKVKYTLLLCISMMAYTSYSQVVIEIDEAINEQLRMKNARIDTSKVDGYRIQISSDEDRGLVKSEEVKFNQEFATYNLKSYSLYQQPYWKIRVGDFYREIDAQELLQIIRISFPNAFVVKDYISRPVLSP